MKNAIHIMLVSLLLIAGSTLNAQTGTDTFIVKAKPGTEVFTFVEQAPEFPGGDVELRNFLNRIIRYPQMERDNNIQGRVIVRFVVMENGAVDSVQIMRGVSPGLDRETVRVIKLLPKFIPGKNNGVPVKTYFNLPVDFKIN